MTTDGTSKAKIERRLAAILAADIAGYSRLMGIDEEATVRDLKAHQSVVLPMIKEHGGRVIDTAGDGILAEFASVLNAVKCAVAMQKTMADRNTAVNQTRRMQFRIGINQGDIVFDDARVYGDSINVAARLEAIAEPGGICVSGKVYEEVQGRIEVTYEDLGAQQLKNIKLPVRVYRVVAGANSEASLQQQQVALALPDKPSIAVLPFTNMSSDPQQEYFSDGITEDIITELSRFSELFVIARNSSFQYKGKSPDIRQVGRELGVHYVLEGSIRRSGDGVRISAQLVDATTGAHRWADRYDRQVQDIFATQAEVVRAIVSLLVSHLNRAAIERTLSKPPSVWAADDYYMKAASTLTSFWRSSLVDTLYETRQLLERCLSIDPEHARALVLLSNTHVLTWTQPLDADFLKPVALDEAYKFARRAVQSDPNLPQAHAQLGWVLSRRAEHDLAISEFEKAVVLNPNFTDYRFGAALVYAGASRRAVQVLIDHMRLDPFYAPAAAAFLGLAHHMLKQYSTALAPLRECVTRAPNFRPAHIWLTATYARMGLMEEAAAEVAEVLRIDPKYTISGTAKRIMRFKNAKDALHLFKGLRLAGLPQ